MQKHQYLAEAVDCVIPKSDMPVTVLCQSSTEQYNRQIYNEFRIYLAKANLTEEEFLHLTDFYGALFEKTPTDHVRLVRAEAMLQQYRKEMFLRGINADDSVENKGLASFALEALMEIGRHYGATSMGAKFDINPAGWNHRVDFYKSKGFINVPHYLKNEGTANIGDIKKALPNGACIHVPEHKLKRIDIKLFKPNKFITELMLDHGQMF